MMLDAIFHMPILAGMSAMQSALIAALCVGVSCGVLGSFVVVRRVALVGDALSHAVFPGVVAGFMWSEERNLLVIFLCAALAGLIGVAFVRAVEKTTRIKGDAALGIVLASFFGIGVLWNSTDQQSGVKGFLFGDLAVVSDADLWLMLGVTSLVLLTVFILLRPFQVLSFDEGFAVGLGYPVKVLNLIFFGLLTFAVVVALQAVGVVLVSAMLITPAATAYLLSDRMNRMMLLSVGFGTVASMVGWWLSSNISSMPPGPVITLVGAGLFVIVYFGAPQHGILAKILRHLRQRQRVERENIMKAIYRYLEDEGFRAGGISLREFTRIRKATVEEATRQAKMLVSAGDATWQEDGTALYLSPSGWRRATEIVRNHRLWELYLTNQANYQADHVHDDAEKIEHVLGAEMVRQLERDLNFPVIDPHGQPIPQVGRSLSMEGKQTTTGFGR